jgi:hypothetical protein
MKLEFSGKVLKKKSSNIQFHKNPSSGSGVVHADRQTGSRYGGCALLAR